MPLSAEIIKQTSAALYQAEIDRKPIDPLSMSNPNFDLEDAYAIQKGIIDRKLADGKKLVGYKIGYTSRAMQKSLNINEPDFGVLLDNMMYENNSEIEVSQFIDPRVEVELAFVLKDRLEGTNLTIEQVLSATDYVIPSLELIDARSYRKHPETGYTRKVIDTVSDNAGNAAVIFGGEKVSATETDLRWCGGILYLNDVIEETGLAAAVLDHPANGICWIAKRFAPHGVALEAGQFLLSGSFTAPIAVKAGDKIRADYGPLGEINCSFV
jgi:2-oxo-hept-3-ene-1,7-dioate hydratase